MHGWWATDPFDAPKVIWEPAEGEGWMDGKRGGRMTVALMGSAKTRWTDWTMRRGHLLARIPNRW